MYGQVCTIYTLVCTVLLLFVIFYLFGARKITLRVYVEMFFAIQID